MPIMFERVWAVGRFDVGLSLFVVPQPRAGTVAHQRCFWAIPRHTISRRAKKGDFPNLVGTAGYTLAYACQKGVLAHTPLLITLVHPLYNRGGKKNSGWLGGVQGARQTLQTLIWSRFDGVTWTSPSAKSSFPLFFNVFLGDTPFCQTLCFLSVFRCFSLSMWY